MAATTPIDLSKNLLFYGDNLQVLREHIANESIDLVYLDPPFNSNRTYNVLFKHKTTSETNAQIQAFDDTWTWSQDDEVLLREMTTGGAPTKVADALEAMHRLIGPSDMLSYLVMMTARLIELRRALKQTGSLYLHCDPVASHYLKIILDSIFGIENFRNEVIWKRTSAHSSAKKWGPIHDVVLYYSKSHKVTWNEVRTGYDDKYLDKYYKFDDGDGRLYWRADLCAAGTRNGKSGQPWRGFDPTVKGMHWKFGVDTLDELDTAGRSYWPKGGAGWPQYKRYREELKGKALGDIWEDIDRINPVGKERLGYPTQKPLALLERILAASSNPGDVVMDPFCGCGTAVDAAERMGRRWIGIDITYLAIDLIDTRLRDTYGPDVATRFQIVGIPRDVSGARALFARNPFDFERWAVSLVDGTPNEKQIGDKGSDGIIRFPVNEKDVGRVIVSVKGGRSVNPGMVRDLAGTVEHSKGQMGVLIMMDDPTAGMADAANNSGMYRHEFTGREYPRVQIITVGDLLAGRRVNMPTPFMPYLQAQKFAAEHPTLPGLG
ncbi:MAG: restriction endonuclease subunit M [Acidimicrobiaceae bacterium]|nr:restriction endonuclease subunit M [Acidimicrobiaceae bacterium]